MIKMRMVMGMIDVVINEDLQGGGDTHIPKKKKIINNNRIFK